VRTLCNDCSWTGEEEREYLEDIIDVYIDIEDDSLLASMAIVILPIPTYLPDKLS
jgi:hypothetical protein